MKVLASPHNVFFEIGDGSGLISFTEVQPRLNASMHFIFYDKKLKGKELTLRAIVKDMIHMCKLRRVSCGIPEDRGAAVKLIRRVGFKQEGWLRKAYLRNNHYLDMGIYGLLSEEIN